MPGQSYQSGPGGGAPPGFTMWAALKQEAMKRALQQQLAEAKQQQSSSPLSQAHLQAQLNQDPYLSVSRTGSLPAGQSQHIGPSFADYYNPTADSLKNTADTYINSGAYDADLFKNQAMKEAFSAEAQKQRLLQQNQPLLSRAQQETTYGEYPQLSPDYDLTQGRGSSGQALSSTGEIYKLNGIPDSSEVKRAKDIAKLQQQEYQTKINYDPTEIENNKKIIDYDIAKNNKKKSDYELSKIEPGAPGFLPNSIVAEKSPYETTVNDTKRSINEYKQTINSLDQAGDALENTKKTLNSLSTGNPSEYRIQSQLLNQHLITLKSAIAGGSFGDKMGQYDKFVDKMISNPRLLTEADNKKQLEALEAYIRKEKRDQYALNGMLQTGEIKLDKPYNGTYYVHIPNDLEKARAAYEGLKKDGYIN